MAHATIHYKPQVQIINTDEDTDTAGWEQEKNLKFGIFDVLQLQPQKRLQTTTKSVATHIAKSKSDNLVQLMQLNATCRSERSYSVRHTDKHILGFNFVTLPISIVDHFFLPVVPQHLYSMKFPRWLHSIPVNSDPK